MLWIYIFCYMHMCVCAQSCDSLWSHGWHPARIHGIFQARILEQVAISSSRESSWPRDRTRVSCITGRFFTIEPPGKPHYIHIYTHTYICARTHSQVYLFTHMNLSNPYFNPRKFIFVAQKKKLPTERLRKLPQVTEPESSKRDWDENQASRCWSPALNHHTPLFLCATKGLPRSSDSIQMLPGSLLDAKSWVGLPNKSRFLITGFKFKAVLRVHLWKVPHLPIISSFSLFQPQGLLPTPYTHFPASFLPACLLCPSLKILAPKLFFPSSHILDPRLQLLACRIPGGQC